VEEKVESIEHNPVLTPAGEVGLQFGKVGATFVDDDRFAIKDGLALKCKGVGDVGEPLGPVVTVAREDFSLAPIDMGLKPVAVVFDFVNPLPTRRSIALQGGELGFNGKRCFDVTFLMMS
jgi:hypothetical protein